MPVLICLFCSAYPALAFLSSLSPFCSAQAVLSLVLSRQSQSGSPVPAVLSWRSCYDSLVLSFLFQLSFSAIISLLSFPDCPALAVLHYQPCPGSPVCQSCFSCRVPPDHFCLSCSACPILFCLSCSGCSLLAVLLFLFCPGCFNVLAAPALSSSPIWQSFLEVLPGNPSWQSCPAALSGSPSWQSCSACPVPIVLFYYPSAFPVLFVLFYLSCPGCPVPAGFFRLSCSGCTFLDVLF
jgi:hypothetical protein